MHLKTYTSVLAFLLMASEGGGVLNTLLSTLFDLLSH